MGGLLFYDHETKTGYVVSDEEITTGFMVLGGLAVVYAISGIITIGITALIMAPFLAMAGLDDFVETFVANNGLFVSTLGVFILLLRFLPRTAGSRLVCFLFGVYVVLTVLYVMLYILHFDTAVYSFFRVLDNYLPADAERALIEVWGTNQLELVTEGHWFYETLNQVVGLFLDVIKNLFARVLEIDGTCLGQPIGEMDIIETLKTLGSYLLHGGIAVVVTLIGSLLIMLLLLVVVVIPYAAALIALAAANYIIYLVRSTRIRRIKRGELYQERLRIQLQGVKAAGRMIRSRNTEDQMEAMEIYRQAAEAGNPMAQFEYGRYYIDGIGVFPDERKGVHWYRKAALQGLVEAQLMMAFAYCEGLGVQRDKMLGKAWLEKVLHDKDFKEIYDENAKIRELTRNLYKITRYSKFS